MFKLFKEKNDCIQTSPYFGGFGKASILPEPNKIRQIEKLEIHQEIDTCLGKHRDVNRKFLPSNNPLSLNLSSGMTNKAKKESVI